MGVRKLYIHRCPQQTISLCQLERHRVTRITASECLEGWEHGPLAYPGREAEVLSGALNMAQCEKDTVNIVFFRVLCLPVFVNLSLSLSEVSTTRKNKEIYFCKKVFMPLHYGLIILHWYITWGCIIEFL